MTTATIEPVSSVGYRMDEVSLAGSFVCLAPEMRVAPREHDSVKVRTMRPYNARPAAMQKTVLRRMQGFLIEMGGVEAKVAFVDAGITHEYYLPSKQLKESGISAENQPFQMDEVEIKTDTSVIVGYEFQPLAKPSDAFSDSFALDPERVRKRDLILKTFGHAKD